MNMKYTQWSRTINGIYSNLDGSIILAAENGPYGGDEINKINYDNNYYVILVRMGHR